MARGLFSDTFQISTNTDTALVTPGAGERIYVYYLGVSVSAVGTTSRCVVENGVNGDAIFRMNTTAADSMAEKNFATARKDYPGYALSPGTVLNIETTGAAAATIDVQVTWEVK